MKKKPTPDKHLLYEASVQNAETDLTIAKRIFRNHFAKQPNAIREDFCGTAKLACTWVKQSKMHEAWAIDIDHPTLEWAVIHNASELTDKQKKRLHLICGDVLTTQTPPIDLIIALNFSFCIFKERPRLLAYFKQAYSALNDDGIVLLDIYGGTEAITAKSDDARLIPGFSLEDGSDIDDFEYIWDQAAYNPINHHTTCHIHFNVPGHAPIKKAFTYHWRLWTLGELHDMLIEAGFNQAEVYLHGFTDEGESDEIFRLRKTYENTEGWVAYIAGIKRSSE